jgi:hypothetical protein
MNVRTYGRLNRKNLHPKSLLFRLLSHPRLSLNTSGFSVSTLLRFALHGLCLASGIHCLYALSKLNLVDGEILHKKGL